MNIDHAVLAKLEKLSHLRISDAKKEETIEQLSGILSYVESLGELDTGALDANFSTLKGGTPLREDTPREPNSVSKEIFLHAPKSQDDFFIVPAIIE